jgi:16S rRNA (cytosine967-C5)-methyltransferase
MFYLWQHIKSIIETYHGNIPLAHFLRDYYKAYPRLGSRDRKILSEMAYCWYRCSKGFEANMAFEEKVKACLQLAGSKSKHIEQFLPEQLEYPFNIRKLFPYEIALTDGISKEDWLHSLLQQPDLFIRSQKPDFTGEKKLLKENNIEFEEVDNMCLRLPNGTPIDKLLPAESYMVQDYSSQQTGSYFKPKLNESWWDCCAGAGGKSLLLKTAEPKVQLTVSDIRASILSNLSERFKLYGLEEPEHFVLGMTDMSMIKKKVGDKLFDGIICDEPCTGSGTWARTPEEMFFFNPDSIQQFTELQKKIAINAAAHLKQNGRLIYITCSVFKQENEEVIESIVNKAGLQLEEQTLVNGIANKADNMFVAVLRKT